MIRGTVSPYREPLIQINVRGYEGEEITVEAVVDTGFTDYLTLAPDIISTLGLVFLCPTRAELADGSEIITDLYRAEVDWDGSVVSIDVMEAAAQPLVGMAMLYGFNLNLDVIDGGALRIRRLKR